VIRGIVFTHASLGEAFCDSVGSFLGPQEGLLCLSNRDLSAEQMMEALSTAVGSEGEGAVVFTALFGGSCWQTAERLVRERTDVRHITGVNLPMLLAFINKRPETELDDLVELVTGYGHRGIKP
jgi:mannose/fructose-specific phosphotransferase system component IIA